MALRRECRRQLLLLTMTMGFGSLLPAANPSALNQAPACSAGPRLCYDTPVNAGPLINTALFEGGPSLSQDGLTLLFGAARRNSLGVLDEDIHMATRETTGEAFGPAQTLGPTVNALGFGDYSPELSLDGLTLYFSSSRPGGQGEADLYVTTRSSFDDPWGQPRTSAPASTRHTSRASRASQRTGRRSTGTRHGQMASATSISGWRRGSTSANPLSRPSTWGQRSTLRARSSAPPSTRTRSSCSSHRADPATLVK